MGKLFDTQLSLEQLRFTLKHQTVLTTKTVVARFRGPIRSRKVISDLFQALAFTPQKIKL
jgi:hypothetical protein